MKIYWWDFWGWLAFGGLMMIFLADELLGIAHVWGLNPITEDAETGLQHGHPAIALLLGALGLVWTAWWAIHLWDHRPR